VTAEAGPSLAIVLFTDVVGSTAQRAALGEERAGRLLESGLGAARHDD
jgi:hypothetical protein